MAAESSLKSARSVAHEDTLEDPREKLHLKPQVVRIEVLGDEKVGKTSLICSLVSRHFSEKVPSVLLNVQIPAEESDENVIISITDTSSRVSDLMRVANATKRSDAILLVYDLTRPETFQRLHRWLDFIARHKEIPVVLVANKEDINGVTPTSDRAFTNQVRNLTNKYPFVVCNFECSAKNFTQVAKAFFYAQKAVLYPVEPIFNTKKRQLQPKCKKAIRRAFRLYSSDPTGFITRDELNEYQHDCFGMRMLSAEMDTMMEFLASVVPEHVAPNGNGINFDGFAYIWQLFIDRNRPESCWQVLRSLGYNNDLDLEIPPERIALPPYEEDQSAQLTTAALEFLTNLFRQFDANKDDNLTDEEIAVILSVCEDTEPPWKTCSVILTPLLYKSTTVDGVPALSLSSWLACWSFVAQENPQKLLETLFYLGYNDKLAPAVEFVKSRSLTRQVNRIERNLVTCYLFGAPNSGKKHFVDAFVGCKSLAPMAVGIDDEIVKAIGAIQDKDSTKYLLITTALSEEEVEKKADVLCLVFNPAETESFDFVEEWDKKLPSSIPRVVIALKFDVSTAKPGDEDLATEARLKQFSTHYTCVDDPASVMDAAALLVRTALRPPRNARLSTSGGLGSMLLRTAVFAVCVIGCGAAFVAIKKPEVVMDNLRNWSISKPGSATK